MVCMLACRAAGKLLKMVYVLNRAAGKVLGNGIILIWYVTHNSESQPETHGNNFHSWTSTNPNIKTNSKTKIKKKKRADDRISFHLTQPPTAFARPAHPPNALSHLPQRARNKVFTRSLDRSFKQTKNTAFHF